MKTQKHSLGSSFLRALKCKTRWNPVRTNAMVLMLGVSVGLGCEGVVFGTASDSEEAKAAAPWQPPVPPPDEFDWIQLTSGEWLKGEFKLLQDYKVEFDSEELDLQIIDWEDIQYVRFPRISTVLFENKITAVGELEVTVEEILIRGQEEQRFSRSDVRAITPGRPREANYWSAKFSVGLAVRSGNTDQSDLNARAKFRRTTPGTRSMLEYLGNVGKLDGERNTDNHRVNTSFDYFLTDEIFLRPVFGEYFRDTFQNLAHRETIGTGAGYRLTDTPKRDWDVYGGPAYQFTRFDSVTSGDDRDEQTPAFVAGTRYESELTDRIDLMLQYGAILTSREAGQLTHHAVSSLEIELTSRLDLDVSLVWDRIENPHEDTSGEVPEQDDLRLTLGLGFEL